MAATHFKTGGRYFQSLASFKYLNLKRLRLPSREFFLFLLAGGIAYANALRIPFLGDDTVRILGAENYFKQGLGPTLANVLSDRPFLTFTNWLEFQFFGLNPIAFKIANILIHCLSGFFLFRFIQLLTRHPIAKRSEDRSSRLKESFLENLPLLLGLLFVVHPAANQSINIMIQRGVLLGGLFSILTLTFFVKFLIHRGSEKASTYYLLSLFTFLLAVLSKPFTVILPIILLLYWLLLYWIIEKDKSRGPLYWILPFVLFASIPSLFLFLFRVNEQVASMSWVDYLSIQSRVVFIYFRLLFLPIHLHYFYDIENDPSFFENYTWLASLGHLMILGAIGRMAFGVFRDKTSRKSQNAKTKALLVFSLFSVYIALIPESGLFPIHHLAFEHRTYFPFLFLFLAAGVFSMSLPAVYRKQVGCFLALVILVFCFLNLQRNNEISTHAKWVVNNSLYYHRDIPTNLVYLEVLYSENALVEFQEVLERSRASTEATIEYGFFEKLPKYPTFSKLERVKFLEELGNALRKPEVILYPQTRHFFNRFILKKLPEFIAGAKLDSAVENLLRPQLDYFGNFGSLFKMELDTYASVSSSIR